MENNGYKKILSDIKISSIIGNYLSLSRKGNNYIAVCPFHEDKHPSLIINDKKGIFKCFACGVSGNAITFLSKYLNISISKAIIECGNILNIDFKKIGMDKYLNNDWVEYDKQYDLNYKVSKVFQYLLTKNKVALKYLQQRKIQQAQIDKFNIGYAPENVDEFISIFKKEYNDINLKYLEEINILKKVDNEYISFFKDRIIFPIKNEDDDIIGFSSRIINNQKQEPKYLNSTESKIFKKQEALYNINNVINDKNKLSNIFIVEGFMDTISLDKININNVVATMGVAFSAKHLEFLKNNFNNLKIITLFFDNDEAGKNAIDNAANLIGNKFHIFVPNYDLFQYKDIDEEVNNNKENAIKIVNNTIDYLTYKINNLLKQNIQNESEKIILFDECLNILNKFYNDFTIDKNIDFISEKLQIDKKIILSKINSKYKKLNNYKKIENQNIVFNTEQKKYTNINILNNINKIQKLETYLLKAFFVNKKYFISFININGLLKVKTNNDMLNKIEYLYSKFSKIDSILNLQIEDIIKTLDLNNEELNYFNSLYNDAKKHNDINDQNYELAFNKYNSLLIAETKNDIIQNNLKNSTDENLTQILNLNKKIKKT